jgi:hypothetical protein
MTTLYKHSSRPEWGMAQLLAERDGKRVYSFSDGRERTFPVSHWSLMVPVGAGPAEDTAPPVSSPPGAPDANDMRALRLQTRLLGDAFTTERYARSVAEQPREGMFGNSGYHLMNEVMSGWLVGEREHFAAGLARAIELLEHGRRVGEQYGNSPAFYAALHAEALALAYWLSGDLVRMKELFHAAALAETEYFDGDPKGRRTTEGSLLLRWMAAGDPQRGLEVARAVKIARPRAHPEDPKTGYQHRYYDTLGRTLTALAEDLVKGAPGRAVYARAMKYLSRELAKELSRRDYGFFDFPEHAVWMKVFTGDVLGVGDPETALASLYLLMPTVKQPAAIARRLAACSLLRER